MMSSIQVVFALDLSLSMGAPTRRLVITIPLPMWIMVLAWFKEILAMTTMPAQSMM
jgi:hypothetical protein